MFRFSITDLGLFLGKSPITIRAWERKGHVSLPRVGANRSLTIDEVRLVADAARARGRISEFRLYTIHYALDVLRTLEKEKI